MNRIYQIKRRFLIRLLSALGFGGVIAYCVCSCDSRPVSQDVRQADAQDVADDSQAVPDVNKEIEFQIEFTPADAEVYILENNTETLLSKQSPCTYRFDTAKNSVGLKITAPGHKPRFMVINKDTNTQIKLELEPKDSTQIKRKIINDIKPKNNDIRQRKYPVRKKKYPPAYGIRKPF